MLDRMRYSAVIREIEIIGEAVGKLSAELKQAYLDIPWQDITPYEKLLDYFYGENGVKCKQRSDL